MAPNPLSPSSAPLAGAAEPLLMVAEDHSEVSLKALREEDDARGGAGVAPAPAAAASSATHATPAPALQPVKWGNVALFSFMHLFALYAATFLLQIKWQTWLWEFLLFEFAGLGVTGGAHRLWTHRAYKAKLPLRIILMVGHTVGGMNSIFDWVRDHRVHHKFSETDADPHNAKRGFFFAHVGWLLVKKHPEVLRRGRTVDMSDISSDPVCMFERRHHTKMFYVMCFLLPVVVPVHFWGESAWLSFCACWVRWVLGINFVWSVNSAAHLYGSHPFNKYIAPADNRLVSFFCMGEGWHNYHHVFPWDFKAAELGKLNTTMHLINMFAWLGLAYDLKTAPRTLIRRVAERYGDGSHPEWASHAPEVPEAAVGDPTVVDSLPPPPARAASAAARRKDA